MPGRSALFRVVATVVPLCALTGCPQLLSDEFSLHLDDDNPPVGGGGSDAGAGGSTSGGGAGGTGNSGGSGGDAIVAPPPSEIQVALNAALVHRYRFDAEAPLLDSVGGANAVSVGATFNAGAAVLAGTGTGQYIDLPNGLLSGLSNASFEVWVTWDVTDPTATAAEWQRIFDLGRNPSSVEGQQCALNVDATALYLTPRTDDAQLQLLCETCTGSAIASSSLPVGVTVQLVAVVDDDANLLNLYRDGALAGSRPFSGSLSQITNCTTRPAPCDWNNWLGRSNHVEDPPFKGKILDFRVYSAALRAEWIQASFDAGPDADW